MSNTELYKLSLLPRGTLTEIDSTTGLPVKIVYQRVHQDFGNIPSTGSYGLQRRAHVIPYDPQTPAQITQRNKMSSAVSAWQTLSTSEKKQWSERAEKTGLTGYQYFIGQHIKDLI